MMKEITEKRPKRNTFGSVLVLAVTTFVVLSIIGLVLIRLGASARLQAARTVADISARAAADAGLTQAVRLMNKKLAEEPIWDNTTLPSATDEPLHNSDASLSIDIKGNQDTGFLITSTGKSGVAERKVYNRLDITSLWFGIGVKQNVIIRSKTTFSTIPEGSDFIVWTNSVGDDSIKLYPNTYIPGDIIVGPGGDPDTVIDTKASSVIGGDTFAAEEEIEFPDVTVPDLLYKGALPAPDPLDPNLIKLRNTDSGIYDNIDLGQGKKLHVVDGEVVIYVTDYIRLHNSAELRILDNATEPSVKLYLGGNMQADNGSIILTENHTEKGTRLKIFGTDTCTSIILMNSGDLSAAIYAPYADLEIKNSGTTYGSFTGNNLEMKNSGTFIYDTRLADVVIDDVEVYMM
jgi:Tfp pilus assembly protein PilX